MILQIFNDIVSDSEPAEEIMQEQPEEAAEEVSKLENEEELDDNIKELQKFEIPDSMKDVGLAENVYADIPKAPDIVLPDMDTEEEDKEFNLEDMILSAATAQGIEIPKDTVAEQPKEQEMEEFQDEDYMSEEDLQSAEDEFLNGPAGRKPDPEIEEDEIRGEDSYEDDELNDDEFYEYSDDDDDDFYEDETDDEEEDSFYEEDEEDEEENQLQLSEENKQILDEMGKDQKKKGKKEKKPKKEKAAKEKKPKKEKKRKEKKEKIPEVPEKKLSLKKVIPIVVVCISLGAVILLLSSFLTEYMTRRSGRKAYYAGDYQTCYQNFFGKELDETEQVMYSKSESILTIRMWLREYEVFVNEGSELEALDSLLQAVHDYPSLLNYATEYNAQDEVTVAFQEILNVLSQKYGLSQEEAQEIADISNNVEYTQRVMTVLQKLGLESWDMPQIVEDATPSNDGEEAAELPDPLPEEKEIQR